MMKEIKENLYKMGRYAMFMYGRLDITNMNISLN